ncbi:MAG: aryl-sulfate sulfotransferase [Rhodothermales bacterium]|nr:aryl-sulfate sulfotransferase [Rhodothermales bacterium]
MPCISLAQTRTVGVVHSEAGAYDGYTFFAPRSATRTFLVDMEGRLVHTWESDYTVANPAYLLEDGSVLRTATFGRGFSRFDAGGVGARVEQIDWDGELRWAFELAGDSAQLHHDIEPLPNGNILMMAWVYKSRQEAIEQGRDSLLITDDGVWPEAIIEVRPTGDFGGEIVWQWNVWDHLVQDYDPGRPNYGDVSAHPELIDLNFAAERGKDWIHFNAIAYNAELDQILISNRGFDEIWIIDHGTTTEEAAGHTGGRYGRGGDLLYRWGNPAAYRAGTESDQQLFGQHDSHWIADGLEGEGRILLFNNGFRRPAGAYSSADEVQPPQLPDGSYMWPASGEAFDPTEPFWSYTAPVPIEMYSAILSSAQRLPNGNTLICTGAWGTVIEITPTGEEVWRYVNPVVSDTVIVPQYSQVPDEAFNRDANTIFRAYRFGPDHPALSGRDLTPGLTIEDGALSTSIDHERPALLVDLGIDAAFPNPFHDSITFSLSTANPRHLQLVIVDVLGREVRRLVDDLLAAGPHQVNWNGTDDAGRRVAAGVYIAFLESDGHRIARTVTRIR